MYVWDQTETLCQHEYIQRPVRMSKTNQTQMTENYCSGLGMLVGRYWAFLKEDNGHGTERNNKKKTKKRNTEE